MLKKFLLVIVSLLVMQNSIIAQELSLKDFYILSVQRKIQLNWLSPCESKSKTALVSFNVDKTGKTSDVVLMRSSGDKDYDKRAVMSIYKGTPFDVFPNSMSDNTVKLIAFFNTNTLDVTPVNSVSKNGFNNVNKYNQVVDGINYGYYLFGLEQKINSNWKDLTFPESQYAILVFNVHKDGSVDDTHILRSSGNPKFDASVLSAVKNSIPFDSIPDNFDKDSMLIQGEFAFNSRRNYDVQESVSNLFAADVNSILIQDYNHYRDQVALILDANLPSAKLEEDNDILLKVEIDKIGNLTNLVVEKPSADQNLDALVLSAIKKSSFPAIPESLNKTKFVLEYFITTKDCEVLVGKKKFIYKKKLVGKCIW